MNAIPVGLVLYLVFLLAGVATVAIVVYGVSRLAIRHALGDHARRFGAGNGDTGD